MKPAGARRPSRPPCARTCRRWPRPRRPGSRSPGCASASGHPVAGRRADAQRRRRPPTRPRTRAATPSSWRPRPTGSAPRSGDRNARSSAPRRPRRGRRARQYGRGRRRRGGASGGACCARPRTGARGWPRPPARSTRSGPARPPPTRRSAASERRAGGRRPRRAGAGDFTALETQVAGLDAGEEGLDAEHEAAIAALDHRGAAGQGARRGPARAERDRAALAARATRSRSA